MEADAVRIPVADPEHDIAGLQAEDVFDRGSEESLLLEQRAARSAPAAPILWADQHRRP